MKKMKKISILLLAIFFIGIANVNAQPNATTETVVVTEEIIEVKTCAKSGKVCDATCENKKKGTCCKGENKKSCSKSEKAACSKSKSKCSKSKKGEFDYGTTNDYSGEKSSCSKKSKKSCKKSCSKKVLKSDEYLSNIPPPKKDNSSKE
jgi:hypothetical protein